MYVIYGLWDFLMFLKEAHKSCIYLIENSKNQENCDIFFQFKTPVFYLNKL